MNSLSTLLLAAALSLPLLLTACATNKTNQPEVEPQDFAQVAERITQPNESTTANANELGSVYFLYNKVFIPYEYRKVVRAHAEFLKANPSLNVILEGNADIGGQRKAHNKIGLMRAEEVKKRLVHFGVEPRRVAIATYGSDKPQVEGTTQEEWQPNRRVDFIYVAATPAQPEAGN